MKTIKLVLIGTFSAITMWLSAQDGKLNTANLLEISNSSISNISSILRPIGYDLQHTKEYSYLLSGKNITVQEVIWGYRATYNKDDTFSSLPAYRNDRAAIYIFLEKGKITPFAITYEFNNETIYNSFFDNLKKLGYQKVNEEVQIEKIIIAFENRQTEKIILLSERTTLSEIFKYSFTIGDI